MGKVVYIKGHKKHVPAKKPQKKYYFTEERKYYHPVYYRGHKIQIIKTNTYVLADFNTPFGIEKRVHGVSRGHALEKAKLSIDKEYTELERIQNSQLKKSF